MQKIVELLIPRLDDLALNEEAYGLQGGDFSRLYIGNPVQSYTMFGGMPIKDLSSIYPVFY